MGVGSQRHTLAALPSGKRPGSHSTGGYVGPRADMDGCGKYPLMGIRSPDRPVRSKSLYRLSYPRPRTYSMSITKKKTSLIILVREITFFLCSEIHANLQLYIHCTTNCTVSFFNVKTYGTYIYHSI